MSDGGKGKVTDYNGGRDASSLAQFAAGLVKGGSGVPQLLEMATFKKKCIDKAGGLCVLVFLPHILDDFKSGRNERLEVLANAKKALSGKPVRLFWLEGGEQSALEEELGLSFGFPAVVALSGGKKRFSVMRAAFSADGISQFVSRLLIGKERTEALRSKEWPKLRKSEPWDGEDGTPPEE